MAEYGISVVSIAAKTVTGGPLGFAYGIVSEGAVRARGKVMEPIVNDGLEVAAAFYQKHNPHLTDKEAMTAALASLLIATNAKSFNMGLKNLANLKPNFHGKSHHDKGHIYAKKIEDGAGKTGKSKFDSDELHKRSSVHDNEVKNPKYADKLKDDLHKQDLGSKAYQNAMNGGKHSTWTNEYLSKSSKEIEKGIKSIDKQIKLHQGKIKSPEIYCPGWSNLDARYQQDLITSKWPSDITRQREQKSILEGILRKRNVK